jgi:hypothetical protein
MFRSYDHLQAQIYTVEISTTDISKKLLKKSCVDGNLSP